MTMCTGSGAQSRDCGMPDLGSEFYARLHDSLRRTETPEVFSKKAEQKAYEALKERNKNFISGLFYSDLIVYDPIVTPYLESLMQRLIAGSPQLFTVRPHLFLSRSKIPNAYTTGSGIIIVNAAYIYQTKTEADLLCCIGHELGHFLSDDVEQSNRSYITLTQSEAYKDSMKDAQRGRFNRYSRLEQTVKQYASGSSGHSRYRESEADSMAVLLLHNAHIPFDPGFFLRLDSMTAVRKLPFSRDLATACTQLGLEGVNIPPAEANGRMKWKKSAKDSADEELLKTHPDCAERFKRTQKFADAKPDTKPIPDPVKEQVYFHLVHYAVANNSIGEALYLLLRDTDFSAEKRQLYTALALSRLQLAARRMERAKTIGTVPADDCSEAFNAMQAMLMRIPEQKMQTLISNTQAKTVLPEAALAIRASEAKVEAEGSTGTDKWTLFDTNPCHYLNEIVSPAR
ncbi:hypothetical protein GCM10023092_14140 [Rurimicrobium arvi]|uniref:Peptidase M48 domain-containing protein n=2 Tax=Rurimicrobium arvi TaxID=2049916 RepID=A0ABP8MP68_9BACT